MRDTPTQPNTAPRLDWAELKTLYGDLLRRRITAATLDSFLRDWTLATDNVMEMNIASLIATTRDSGDDNAQLVRRSFLQEIMPTADDHEQRLKERLLYSKIVPSGFDQVVRRMHADVDLYQPKNAIPMSLGDQLRQEYERLTGVRTVMWKGQEIPLPELNEMFMSHDRAKRRAAWCVTSERCLRDRDAINEIWRRCLLNRADIARNAGMSNWLEYRWRQLHRFDYTSEDVRQLHNSVETIVVPLLHERHNDRRHRLGLKKLRPWDLGANLFDPDAPVPFNTSDDFVAACSNVLDHVDHQFGGVIRDMAARNRVDIGTRIGKAPGAYFAHSPLSGGYIFMNTAPTTNSLMTMIHESGHAVHFSEMQHLRYAQQRQISPDFAEVPSMAMELFAVPSLATGGSLPNAVATKIRLQHLDSMLEALAYNTMVDCFEFWVYENDAAARNCNTVDMKWSELRQRFLPGVDWNGLEESLKTGWQTVLILFGYPLHSLHYVLGQLGALQLWANAMHDWPATMSAYRDSLRAGGTKSTPELFTTAGVKFGLDDEVLRKVAELIHATVHNIERMAS
jgi:oligoendopeptidase F